MNLTELWLQENGFQGELYVPAYIRSLVVHMAEIICVCTVTEDENSALKVQLPYCHISF